MCNFVLHLYTDGEIKEQVRFNNCQSRRGYEEWIDKAGRGKSKRTKRLLTADTGRRSKKQSEGLTLPFFSP
jgi:hypothetical protein